MRAAELPSPGGGEAVFEGGSALAEAVRLIEQGCFGAASSALSKLGSRDDPVSLQVVISAAHELCRTGAAHRRAAEELEAAAKRERTSEKQVRHRLITLLSEPSDLGRTPGPVSARRRRWWRRTLPESDGAAGADEGGAGSETAAVDPPAPATPTTAHAPPAPPAPPALPAPPAPSADVVARVLGPLELVVFGREVREWGSSKGRSVLQYLLLSGGVPVRREVLMELLWPDHGHGSARNNLNVALYALRRSAFPSTAGQGPFIEHRQGAYALGSGVSWWIDRDDFFTAWDTATAAQVIGDRSAAKVGYERAAALYRGRLFEDDASCDWYFPEQRLIEERYLLVLERLAAILLDDGDLESAESTLHRALVRDACRESTHRLLMQCYAGLHQQQLVTRQFHRCIEALDRELGVQPHVETVQLFHALVDDAG